MAKIGKVVKVYTGSLATSTVLDPNEGFIVDTDGTLNFTPRGNIDYVASAGAEAADVEVELPVKSGGIYPIDVGKMDIGNSTTLTTVWIVFGQDH